MPRYEHDCSSCTFLGEHEEYDLYFCRQGGVSDTIVARWDSFGPKYKSGLPKYGMYSDSAIKEGHRIAVERGLLNG